MQGRGLAPVHRVGVADDGRLGRLTENLREAEGGDPLGAEEIRQQIPGAHRGQLVRIPHQNQATVPAEGGEQGAHEGHIHHGGLVHNHRIHLQGVVLVVGKDEAPLLGVILGLQQPVDGGGLGAAGLRQALGGAAGGGGQGGAQLQMLQESKNTPEGGGLARAGPAGEEHQLPPGGGADGLLLQGGVMNALPGLDVQ